MTIKIHQEGWVYFIICIILMIICFPFFFSIGLFFMILSIFIFYFFRDPVRSIPVDNFIVSPADGLITYIGESKPPIECNVHDKYNKISIFLSIFDVHVNRNPIAGKILKIVYIPGKFINANFNKSSSENERNIIMIQNNNKDIIFVSQIAGLIARRIVCNLKLDQKISKGEKFGIIKFGSRVDLYLPTKYNLLVSVGQKVIGGETIISNPENILNIKNSDKI